MAQLRSEVWCAVILCEDVLQELGIGAIREWDTVSSDSGQIYISGAQDWHD